MDQEIEELHKKNISLLNSLPTETVTGPEVAPIGTFTARLDNVALTTVAEVPLKITVLFAGSGSKPLPAMLITEPTTPLGGSR